MKEQDYSFDQDEFKIISLKCLANKYQYNQTSQSKMFHRGAANPPLSRHPIKPTKQNIKQLLRVAKDTHKNKKNSLQQLMTRDVHTTALLHSQASRAEMLWSEIEKIRNGDIGPELQTLKSELTILFEEGLRTGVITNVEYLARLQSTELGKFMELLAFKRNGLTSSLIDAIQYFKYNKESRPNDDICAVCHDEFEEGVECIELECKHTFHRKCISHWLKMKRNCPMCKKDVKIKPQKKPVAEDQNVRTDNVMGTDLRPERRE